MSKAGAAASGFTCALASGMNAPLTSHTDATTDRNTGECENLIGAVYPRPWAATAATDDLGLYRGSGETT